MRDAYTESIRTKIKIRQPEEGDLRKNGTSAKIQMGELATPDQLLAYGFRKMDDAHFVYTRLLGCDIGFHVSVKADDWKDIKIDVMEENFGQPYDYQHILLTEGGNPFTNAIYEKVEAELERLQEAGILQGHVRGDYV